MRGTGRLGESCTCRGSFQCRTCRIAEEMLVDELEAAVIRKAGLFMDMARAETNSDQSDQDFDDMREELFAAIDALREARK